MSTGNTVKEGEENSCVNCEVIKIFKKFQKKNFKNIFRKIFLSFATVLKKLKVIPKTFLSFNFQFQKYFRKILKSEKNFEKYLRSMAYRGRGVFKGFKPPFLTLFFLN